MLEINVGDKYNSQMVYYHPVNYIKIQFVHYFASGSYMSQPLVGSFCFMFLFIYGAILCICTQK